MESDPQAVVQEYFQLVKRSQQLFAGLRDLPQFGRHWQPYFQKTFEVYTKLWKFQQQHRPILENKDIYGLKRWEIGEIASKIGQLYYHYYLRTSDTNYLEEAFIFYDAIRARSYFANIMDTQDAALLVVKKLRFYARFIVVCLILNRRTLLSDIISELQQLINNYIELFKPSETGSWNQVLQEITLFMKCDIPIVISDKGKNVSHRITSSTYPSKLQLQEAIIVGNCPNQVKFSELTLDTFRISQVLERELSPRSEGSPFSSTSSSTPASNSDSKKKKQNPHKYLLYKPSFAQLMMFLSMAYKELDDENVLLLYLSADSYQPKESLKHTQTNSQYTSGGIMLSSNTTLSSLQSTTGLGGEEISSLIDSGEEEGGCNPNTFQPEDLLPFTRKKLFLIVESGSSDAFGNINGRFGRDIVCLMSPTSREHVVEGKGNMFTLFLYAPLVAFCVVVGKLNLTNEVYENCLKLLSTAFEAVYKLIVSGEGIPKVYVQYVEDDLLRAFVVRYLFCHAVFSLHKNFIVKPIENLPRANPALPRYLLTHSVVTSIVSTLASTLGVSDQFADAPVLAEENST